MQNTTKTSSLISKDVTLAETKESKTVDLSSRDVAIDLLMDEILISIASILTKNDVSKSSTYISVKSPIGLTSDEVIRSISLQSIQPVLDSIQDSIVDLLLEIFHQRIFKDEFITLESASLVFGIKSTVLDKWISNKVIKGYKIKNYKLVSCTEIRKVIDSITRTITSSSALENESDGNSSDDSNFIPSKRAIKKQLVEKLKRKLDS